MVKVAEEEHKKEQENNEGGESRVLQQSRKRAAGGDPGEEEEDDEIEDEKLIELARNTTSFDFAVYAREIDNLQSYAGTLMRAARLVVMQRDIDDVDSETEASHLVEGKSGGMDKHVDATKYMRSGHRNTANPFMMVYNAIQHLYLNKEDHGFCDTGADLVVAERVGGYKGVVLSAVRRARERADEIIEDMEKLEDESKKDIMLLQRFVIDSLKGYQRNIALRFVDVEEEEEDEEAGKCNMRWRYFWFLCLILYFLFTSFFIFLFGVRIGPRGVSMWLTGVGIAFLQAVMILQPVKIFMFHIVVAAISAKRVRTIHGVLRERIGESYSARPASCQEPMT